MPERSRWARRFDAACVLAFLALWLRGTRHLLGSLDGAEAALLAVLAVAPGLLLADLATGSVHWFADRFLSESTPLIGPSLIAPFRAHHRAPADMALRSWTEVSGSGCLLMIAPMLAFDSLVASGRAHLPAWLEAVLLSTALAAALTNGFHRWAHAQRIPAAITWLQRRGVILSPAHHALHHRGAHDRAFCVTTGWLNPWLDRVHFFGTLERRIRGAARSIGVRGRATRARRRFPVVGLAKKVRPH